MCDFKRKLHRAPFERFQQLMQPMTLLISRLWILLTDRTSYEAMQWVITLHSCVDLGPVLPNFRQWLNARVVNRDRFVELWDLWQQLGTLKDRSRWNEPIVLENPAPEATQRTAFRWRPAIGLTIITVLILGIKLYLSLNPAPQCNQFSAPHATQCRFATGQHSSGAGETPRLELIDGSTIILSEMSRVTLDFRMDRRHVQLDSGAARFEVAKNKHIAFEVSVGTAQTIRAVGTAFSVQKTGPDSARVKVSEGAVELLMGDQKPFQVDAGQMADFDTNLIRLNESAGVWFLFRGEPLSDAVHEFNRYNPKRKIIVDEDVSRRSVQGRFSATNPQGFADIVAITWGMKCTVSRDSTTGTDTIHLSKAGAHSSSPHNVRGKSSIEEQQ